VRDAPAQQWLERCRIDGGGAVAQQTGLRGAQRVGRQQACFHSRVVDPDRAQSRRGLVQCLLDGGRG